MSKSYFGKQEKQENLSISLVLWELQLEQFPIFSKLILDSDRKSQYIKLRKK